VTAKPNSGYRFINWSDGKTTLSRTDANITSDIEFTAIFATAEQNFTLTTRINPLRSGTVALNPGGGKYQSGTKVALTATPAQGWKFSYWEGPVVNRELPQTTITMNQNQQVIANFTQIGGIEVGTTPTVTTRVPTTPTVTTRTGIRTTTTTTGRVIG
jgi:hypothetical protein